MTTTSASSGTNSLFNTSGINVGSDGKVTVSGLSSGIDTASLISAAIAAKSVPVTNIQTKITANNTKITAYGNLKTKAAALTSALEALRGDPSYGATSAFNTKTATGTTSVVAGAPTGTVASSVGDLLVASVGSGAVNGNYTLTVSQLATAEQDRSDPQSSQNTALGLSGSLSLNGANITVSTTDTLLDIRTKINNSSAGVTAAIVSASGTANYLVLTANNTGAANAINFGGGTALSDTLGLTDSVHLAAGVPKTQLQVAQNSILTVNGIPDIERATNSVSDVIGGVTLSLQKADANTQINLSISPDLSTIETDINTLVSSYNDLRSFITTQRTATDLNGDGTVDPSEVGPLAYDSTLRQVADQLSALASATVPGNPDGYQSLAQLGVTLGDDYTLSTDTSKLDTALLNNVSAIQNLFALNTTTSDSRATVLARGASTVAGTYTLNIAGTDASGNLTGANLTTSGAGGASDSSGTVSGSNITANSSSLANGLVVHFNGGANAAGVDGITITVSRGIADQAYDFFNSLTAASSGTLDTLVTGLQTQDNDYQSQVSTLNDRIALTKASLTTKYANMETALSAISNLKQTIASYADSLNSSSSS